VGFREPPWSRSVRAGLNGAARGDNRLPSTVEKHVNAIRSLRFVTGFSGHDFTVPHYLES
jgi:hypothetical protein